ncbi:hypothetical protein AKO1_007395 [Acrasis kona]|uniref:Uncharacterized protein n=1 Tax=Acrasis kona TaxID=1008807 RepID=A0AAW2YRV4_9EUKA
MGENAFSFVKSLACLNQHFPDKDQQDMVESAVFFDLLEYSFFVVNQSTAYLINTSILVACVATIIVFIFTNGKGVIPNIINLFSSMLSLLLNLLFCLIFPIASSLFLIYFNCQLSFYQHEMYVLVLYGIPSLLGMLIVYKLPLWSIVTTKRSILMATLIVYSSLLGLLVYNNSGSACLLTWYASAVLLSTLFSGSSSFIRVIKLVIVMIPNVMASHYAMNAIHMFVPIMGRIGDLPADVIIGVTTSVIVWIMFLPIIHLLFVETEDEKNVKFDVSSFFLCFLSFASFVCICLSMFVLTPYSSKYPKRLNVQHVYRYEYVPVDLSQPVHVPPDLAPRDNYLTICTMDPITETYIPKDLHFEFDYNMSHPVFVVGTFAMTPPLMRAQGWFSHNTLDTEHGMLPPSKTIHPVVDIHYNKKLNRTDLIIDESSDNLVPLFSLEVNVFSTKILTTSFGDVGPRVDVVMTSENKTIYCHKWFYFRGVDITVEDKVQNIWLSADNDEMYHGILKVQITSVAVQKDYHTVALEKVMTKIPDWISAGPAVISTLDIYVTDKGQYGEYKLPDLLLSPQHR